MTEQTFPLPGAKLVLDMPNGVYHSGPELSASRLGPLLKTAAHFQYGSRYVSEAMHMGSLFHTSVLEPDRIGEQIIRLPDINWRTIDGKDQLRKFLATRGIQMPEKFKKEDALIAIDAKGLIMASAKGVQTAVDMGASLLSSYAGQRLLHLPGLIEASIFFEEHVPGFDTPVKMRCRPDKWITSKMILDLKKSEDASPERFPKHAVDFGYHRQAYLYRRGVYAITGEWLPFVFPVVEDKGSNEVAWYRATEEFLELGKQEYWYALSVFAEGLRDQKWRGYPDDILDLDPPTWAKPKVPESFEAPEDDSFPTDKSPN